MNKFSKDRWSVLILKADYAISQRSPDWHSKTKTCCLINNTSPALTSQVKLKEARTSEPSTAQTAHAWNFHWDAPGAVCSICWFSAQLFVLIEPLYSNLVGSQQCIPPPLRWPKASASRSYCGSQGEKHAKHDDLQTPRTEWLHMEWNPHGVFLTKLSVLEVSWFYRNNSTWRGICRH